MISDFQSAAATADSDELLRQKIIEASAKAAPPLQHAASPIPCVSQQCVTYWAMACGGTMLAALGLGTRSLPGLVIAAAGGGLAYHGITQIMNHPACQGLLDTPHRPDAAVQRSVVDESSWESFPASDAPSGSQITA